MGLLKIFFTIFIFIFPLAELGRFQFPNGVAFSINEIILVILIFSWLIHKINKKETVGKSLILKSSVIFAGIAFISLLLNISNLSLDKLFVSFLYLLRWISYLLLFFIVKDFDINYKKKIPYFMLFSGAIVVLGGYIQFFLYPSLRNLYYLGWDEHLYRMFSSFLDPNFLGTFLVLLLMLILGFLYKYLRERKLYLSLILSVLGITTLIATYLTYSRSALVMLIVSLASFLFLIGKKKIILISILGLILIIFLIPKSFKTEGTNFLRTASSEARIGSAEIAFKIFQGSPFYGVGFNAYRYSQNKYGLDNKDWMITHSGAGTDNSFLFVLATTGVIGFASFIYFILSFFVLAKKNLKKNIFSIILFSSLAGLIVNSLFINSLFYVFILEWIWIIGGLTESK